MKKTISVMLGALLLLGGIALAEDTQGEIVEPVIGRISEMREDGGFTVDTLQGTQVMVNVHEDTRMEASWTPDAGDVVTVLYDGTMTRSQPPQISAQAIQCYSLEGQVSQVNAEGNRVLINSPEFGQVWASLPEDTKAEDYAGETVRIYFNGIMAMSMPGQVGAYSVESVVSVSGTIAEIGADYFMLDGEEGEYRVNFGTQSKIVDDLAEGAEVIVYYSGISTRSLPPQIFGTVIIPVTTAG